MNKKFPYNSLPGPSLDAPVVILSVVAPELSEEEGVEEIRRSPLGIGVAQLRG